MGKFKIGDRVRRISGSYGDVEIGTTGVIVSVNRGGASFRVEIEPEKIHTWASSYIERVNDHLTTVIYRKDRETIATLKEGGNVIKTAKAICHPNDEFNAEYGAKLAFARLYGIIDEKFSPMQSKIVRQNKYEVGDKVKIREDLVVREWYNEAFFNSDMRRHIGKILTITRATALGNYQLNTSGPWIWSSDMIEGKVVEESPSAGPSISAPQDCKAIKSNHLSGIPDEDLLQEISRRLEGKR